MRALRCIHRDDSSLPHTLPGPKHAFVIGCPCAHCGDTPSACKGDQKQDHQHVCQIIARTIVPFC
jgi:hypothetical protein